MINPSPAAILKTVLASLDAVLLPGLETNLSKASPETVSADKLNLSTAITMGHLLRHVLYRLERENTHLRGERALLEALLKDLRTYMDAHRDETAASLIRSFDEFFATGSTSCGGESASLADEVGAMRLLLNDALAWLQRRRAALGKQPTYQQLRREIRRCIAFQLECESELIDAAMSGRGYRR